MLSHIPLNPRSPGGFFRGIRMLTGPSGCDEVVAIGSTAVEAWLGWIDLG